MDHLHGLCKDCVSKFSDNFTFSKNETECSGCNQNPPEVIYQDGGSLLVLCTKCYLRQASSPRKRSEYSNYSKKSESILLSPNMGNSLFHSVSKSDVLNKGFFASEGKMIGKIQKFFSKYESRTEDAIKELGKRSLIQLPLNWEKILATCNKAGNLMFVFANQTHILGFYHLEPIKLPDKLALKDKESGFFMSPKSKLDFQFFKATSDLVTYNKQFQSISIGQPACLEVILEGSKPKVRCQIFHGKLEEWPEVYLYKH